MFQAVFRKARKYGLQRALRRGSPAGMVVRKLLCLRLIPPQFICLAYQHVKEQAPEDERLEKLYMYMENTW